MSDFLTYIPPPAPKDTTKRVRFRTGLVLGEEEFQQDQAYFLERDRRHQRALHGYGTVCGLALELHDTSDGPEVLVRPGLAVNPAGETIVVHTAQCAALNAWLRGNRSAIDGLFGSPPGSLTLDVQLCYRDCATDPKPVPGGPCRTQDELMQKSRMQDDFLLQLKLFDSTSPLTSPLSSPLASPAAPVLPEDQAIRAFGDILGSIVADGTAPFTSAADLVAFVRELAVGLGSPPFVLSPPAPLRPATISLDPATAEASVRSALLAWVTQVRPRIASGCALSPPNAPCVSLGHLLLTLDPSGEVSSLSAVNVDETMRPFLIGTQLLQEWSLASMSWMSLLGASGPGAPVVLAGDVAGPPGATTVQAIQGNLVAAATSDGDMLRFEGGTSSWVPQAPRLVRAESGPYRVAAAGAFDASGSPRGPTYGSPTVTRIGASPQYDVTFPGYVRPTLAGSRMLIIRGTVDAGTLPGVIAFRAFSPSAIRILVQDTQGNAANRNFQLEIMEYGP